MLDFITDVLTFRDFIHLPHDIRVYIEAILGIEFAGLFTRFTNNRVLSMQSILFHPVVKHRPTAGIFLLRKRMGRMFQLILAKGKNIGFLVLTIYQRRTLSQGF
jgi:hypothetical protein